MNKLLTILPFLSGTSEGGESSGESTASKTSGTLEAIKNAFKGPVPYIIIGAIVLLIIAVYLIRRNVKAIPNTVRIVVRHGQVYKVIDESNPKYFLVPFTDSIGANISLNEQSFASDKLYINDGPDALYKINFVIKYQVTDAVKHFEYVNNFSNLATTKINDDLREYADNGNAMNIVKDYRQHNDELIALLDKSLSDYGVKVNSFKINFVEPLGKK